MHYRNECPNARAFTNIEWSEINNRERGPRAMLVAKDGEERVILPPTPVDEPEGSYILTSLGTLQRRKPEDSESSESEGEHIEQIYPEEECFPPAYTKKLSHNTKRKEGRSKGECFPNQVQGTE